MPLLLEVIGIYGIVSYAVVKRTNEIGVRMALGATHTEVVRVVVEKLLFLVLVGVIAGIPLSLLFVRVLRNQLYGVSKSDQLTLCLTVRDDGFSRIDSRSAPRLAGDSRGCDDYTAVRVKKR